MTISEQLESAVEDAVEKGKSLNSIAVDSGIPYPMLCRWYHGERGLNLATADKLAEFLGMRLTQPRRV